MTGSSTDSTPDAAPGAIAGDNPFVGPRPLGPDDELYGREREIAELGYRLHAERVVLLHSPSGAGKSSLIQAGLLPELRASFDVCGPTRVNAEPVDAESNRYVASAIAGFEEGLPEAIRRPAGGLAGLTLASYFGARPRRRSLPDRLLVFDQFEEVLTADPLATAAKEDFFDQLGKLLRDRQVWALLVLREDYLAPLDPYAWRLPTQLENRFRIDRLDLDGAHQVMVETARDGGRVFPAAGRLADDLATMKVQQLDGSFVDQKGRYVEPVQLQVVCRWLWDELEPEDLSIDEGDLERLGDVGKALSIYYDASTRKVASGDPAEERAIREWFDERLITAGGIRAQVQKGGESSGDLANQHIARLRDSHLIRAEQRAGATWFELAHDRLIEPVRESNDRWFQAKLQPVQRQAKLWLRQGEPSGLLLGGRELAAAEHWAAEDPAILTGLERRFLDKSRAAQDAAERERRQARWIKVLAVAATIVSVLALAAGFFARIKWLEAEVEKKNANDAKIVAEDALAKVEPFQYLAQLDALYADYSSLIERPHEFGVTDLERLEPRRAELIAARPKIETTLGGIEEPALRQVLQDLIADLEALELGVPADARGALSPADKIGLLARSVLDPDHDSTWRRAIRDIAADDGYGQLEIEPQIALVPLGRDPGSGLWEFAHVLSGELAEWDCQRAGEAGEQDCILRQPDMGLVLVLLPPGRFLIGSVGGEGKANERPSHELTLAQPFFLSKYEVTQYQWRRITGQSPSYFPQAPLRPVEQVGWDDADRVLGSVGLRLPSEAEWEYGARAGSETAYAFGEDAEGLDDHAWYDKKTWGPGDVGVKLANGFGLHDVHGNVWEWVRDSGHAYPKNPADGSAWGVDLPHIGSIIRGGAWNSSAINCRSARREVYTRSTRDYYLGVRAARSLRP